eukprot:327007_1
MGQCICRGTRDQTIIDDESIHSNHSDEIPNHGTDHELKMDMHNINAYDCDPDVQMNPDCSPRCYKSILFPCRSYDNQDVLLNSFSCSQFSNVSHTSLISVCVFGVMCHHEEGAIQASTAQPSNH